MKSKYNIHIIYRNLNVIKLLLVTILLTSCEDFVEIDHPNDQLSSEIVFEDASTVNAAVVHIYSQLRNYVLTHGGVTGVSYLSGLYTDELTLYGNLQYLQFFYDNNLVATDNTIANLWNASYNLIYATNSILEGVENSATLTDDEKNQFLGEAYFLRAFIHFYLTNLFGDIPYVETTDYVENSQVSRLNKHEIYQNIIADLMQSKSLLSIDYIGADRVRPNKWVAAALLARVYLYEENWELALSQANEIISNGGYTLNNDINQVFLKDSNETLWQYDSGMAGFNTIEAITYIFTSAPPPTEALSSSLINSFEAGDSRFTNWTGAVSDGTNTWYYPFKYKLSSDTGTTQEYSIVFRLAEQYLIAAEANAQLGNTTAALQQLNIIRERASLPPITDDTALLDVILQERRIEFFTEYGHRFFDLKRTDKADSQLPIVKPNWSPTDMLFPIPESEIILNPNLEPQNQGY